MQKRNEEVQTTRRDFIRTTGAVGAGLYLGGVANAADSKPVKLE
ncbi:MAG: twin-arginine translocation signal domain-containing protein, partial [Candidatus Omnitrophica bacterium]|nr:twin-arginine translocation signal domain-containing protein [Candidatus Omnitrophota bacterium]